MGKINFLRCFVPNFIELIKHINVLLKKYAEFRWKNEAKNSFLAMKSALTEALVLIGLDFEKYFLNFSYASEETIAAVLLQKNKEGLEQLTYFFIHTLRDVELKYNFIEK